MSKTRKIKDALKQVLSGIEYEDEPAFIEVVGSTDGEFEGYPSVRVLPERIDNAKGAMGQNDREVNFKAIVHMRLESGDAIQEHTIDHMTDLTDLIMDALDQGDYLDTLDDIDPDIGTYIMKATDAVWDVIDSSAGAILLLVVSISATYSKDL
ncbi:hypothetical protein [Rhodococcus qingshengii]|uniref:hypothetical protein n=1 Tax=Rhodococcus qingshengii TaxID=334542 RepID=UPI002942C9DC|nr:hypothetical protein [Rhodococcus qingshengii]WOI85994.1 hypothetical protein R0122_22710 [Rhodococcus qingshengii]